ncbi:MAG: hypothetical protein M1565_04375 [Actinobacteria bacterium]|nr:hypothetical protein [Actinomycetota bacterium]MCL5735217.1 hypothetical protein [Actinomycetota bacterium]
MAERRTIPPHVPTDKPPRLDELVRDLKVVLKAGLPITPSLAIPALLALRGVWARAVDPEDELARVDAADRLLRAQLKKISLPRMERSQLAVAVANLFGTAGSRGKDLTHRRIDAAHELGYDVDHLRKRIEPKIVEQLAWQLHQDSLQYVPRARKYPPAEASGDTPTITDEDISDPERARHEILLSRIWAEVYGLRADLIAREVHQGKADKQAVLRETSEAVELRMGVLLNYLDDYLTRYGDRILHGEAEFNAEALIRLAGWRGELSEQQARELRWKARRRANGFAPD